MLLPVRLLPMLFLCALISCGAALPVPPPALDPPATTAGIQTAVFAGGCFWGVDAVFKHVKGVSKVVSGYAGGPASMADYETVSSGTSGHAESVQITFDPAQITYGKLLRIFFSVAHDPTELNRQGPDWGTQYRSAIFAANDEQKRIAEAYIAQLNQSKAFRNPIVTKVTSGDAFYPAEPYHQDFLAHNMTYPYIVMNDLPKLGQLKKQFPDLYTGK